MKGIYCMGEMLIDFIGEKKSAHMGDQSHFLMKAGGAPANVACVIGALGGKSYFLGAVGKDGFGDFLCETLEKYRVQTQGLLRSNQSTTLAFVALDEAGERDFVFYRGADAHLSYEAIALFLEDKEALYHFGAATAFLEGPLKDTYDRVLKQVTSNHAFVSFDPNYRSAFWANQKALFVSHCKPFLERANLVKLSEEEAQMVTGKTALKDMKNELRKAYEATFAITLGKEGALVFNRKWERLVPAKKTNVLDTTGAGDAFIGSLLKQLSACEDPFESVSEEAVMVEMVKEANGIGALVCTAFGALTALDEMKEESRCGN